MGEQRNVWTEKNEGENLIIIIFESNRKRRSQVCREWCQKESCWLTVDVSLRSKKRMNCCEKIWKHDPKKQLL
jgi:hypothetical protein